MFEFGLLAAYVLAIGGWAYTLRRKLGLTKAITVASLRLVWTLPLVLGAFPKQEVHQQFDAKRSHAVYALVDDSASTRKVMAAWQANIAEIRQQVASLCGKSCELKVTRYSDLAPEAIKAGYTPTEQVIRSFLDLTKGSPFIWFTDGGHQNPDLSAKALASRFRMMTNQGFIISGPKQKLPNLTLVPDRFPTVSFSEKPIQFKVGVRRSAKEPANQQLQIHVQLNEQNLKTVAGAFSGHDETAEVAIKLKPLPKGRHFLKVKVLAMTGETATWDNEIIVPVEVVSDTIGVLHILGSPSWGGRFMRQFFKSEPKYDLISFYILRDPSDHYGGDDRSLSLIPFPVERLFTKELPNFKFVVIHNFTLHKFLEPQYVDNLVKYVENGGGLLFIGGERALLKGDFTSSPLQKLLPFTLKKPVTTLTTSLLLPRGDEGQWEGPYYDPSAQFWLELDDPPGVNKADQEPFPLRTLIRSKLRGIDRQQPFTGLHRLSEVNFSKDGVKPILYARDSQNHSFPLMVASFPKKGRALWLFTDNLWRLGFEEDRYRSYGMYRHLFSEATSWLTHKSLRSSLRITSARLSRGAGWQADVQLSGDEAVAAYESDALKLSICGVAAKDTQMERISSSDISLTSAVAASPKSGSFCEIVARYTSPHHGLIEARTTTKVPVQLTDRQLAADDAFLAALAEHGELTLVETAAFAGRSFKEWLEDRLRVRPEATKQEEFIVTNPFWRFADKAWFWLLLALPAEITFRKRYEFT